MAFVFYGKCAKRGRKIGREKKPKKVSQFLKSHISGMLKAISLKFGMRSTEVGGRVHSKNRLFCKDSIELWRCKNRVFFSSCQYTHGVAHWLLGHTTHCRVS